MSWFNVYGRIYVLVILIPNLVFAMRCKDGFVNRWQNKTVETLEQIGRFGCLLFMIVQIPGTVFQPWSDTVWMLYFLLDTVFALAYCTIWIVCFRKTRTGTVDSAVTAFSRKRYSDPLDPFDCRCLPLCTDTYPAVVQKCRRGTDGKMIFT